MNYLNVFSTAILITFLVGCGGSGSSDTNDSTGGSTILVNGAGVKGPLINANVTAYIIDPSQVDLKGDIIARGNSNTSAALQLAIPEDRANDGPFLIEYTDGTETDGQMPVIESLSTIITSQQLLAGTAVYATPLSTFALEHARQIADNLENTNDPITTGLSGDNNGSVSISELLAALETASANIKATLGLGLLTEEINLFTTSPLINEDTDAEDTLAIRTANEVFAAIVETLKDEITSDGLTATGTALVAALADDFADGSFNKQNADNTITVLNTIDDLAAALTNDPALLNVPNSDRNISQINEILAEEAEELSTELPTVALNPPVMTAPLASLYTEENPKPVPPVPDKEGEPVLRNVALSWGIPTTRTDGSLLPTNEIDYYEIYYSSTSNGNNNDETITVSATNSNNELVNDHEINALPTGEYYFSIATVDTAGIASEFINPIALMIE
ncbi:hypothetical protein N9L91_02310 [Pseudomonadales bacterium]|nr:hypothetical protein [Pseudomonadales bacterium]